MRTEGLRGLSLGYKAASHDPQNLEGALCRRLCLFQAEPSVAPPGAKSSQGKTTKVLRQSINHIEQITLQMIVSYAFCTSLLIKISNQYSARVTRLTGICKTCTVSNNLQLIARVAF